MADLNLERPQQGQRVEIAAAADARIVLNFPTDQAMLERADDNLVFTFEDGGAIVINNFYKDYTKDSLPDFLIEGQPVSGEQFFAALGDDLMPAAGPAAAATPPGGSSADYGSMAFMSGIDRLDGLDLGWNNEPQVEDTLNGFGSDGGLEGIGGYAAGPLNLTPEVRDQYGFVIEDDPDHNVANGNSLTGSVMGDGAHTLVWSPDNSAQHGTFIQNPNGTFSYVLNNDDRAVQALGTDESMQEIFEFTYIDENGDSATGRVIITINGVNDPLTVTTDAKDLSLSVKESGVGDGHDPMAPVPGHVTDGGSDEYSFTVNDKDANDEQHVTITVTDKNGEPVEGLTITTNEDGTITVDTPEGRFVLTQTSTTDEFGSTSTTYTYKYELDDSGKAESLNAGDERDYKFNINVSDNHGSSIDRTVDVHIEGTNDAPSLNLSKPDGQGAHIDVTDTASSADAKVTHDGNSLVVKDVDADGTWNPGTGDTGNHRFEITLTQGETETKIAVDGELGKASTFETDYGTLTVKPDGTYTFTPNESAVSALGDNENAELKFDVTVYDKHGAHSEPQSITVNITGTNEGPDINTDGETVKFTLKEAGVGSFAEAEAANGKGNAGYSPAGANNHQIAGTSETGERSFTITDRDANDTQTLSVSGKEGAGLTMSFDPATGVMTVVSAYGTMSVKVEGYKDYTVNEDGSVTFTPADAGAGIEYKYSYSMDQSKVDSLKPYDEKADYHGDGVDSVKEHFDIKVSDSAGESQTQPVDITIEGTNDAPDIGWSGIEVKEEGVYGDNHETHPDPFPNNPDNPDPNEPSYIFPSDDRTVMSGQIPAMAGNGLVDQDAGAKITYGVGGLWISGNSWKPVNEQNVHLKDPSGKNDILEDGKPVTENVKILNTDSFAQTVTGEDGDKHQIIITNYGVLDLNTATGEYTFTLGVPEGWPQDLIDKYGDIITETVNGMAEGERLDLSFQATATDEFGAKDVHGISVIIKGSNDQPTLEPNWKSDLDGNVEYENGRPVFDVLEGENRGEHGENYSTAGVALGNVGANDADRGADLHFGLSNGAWDVIKDAPADKDAVFATDDKSISIKGEYGTLSIDKDGNLSYQVDNRPGSAADKLGAHQDENGNWIRETGDDTFTIYVMDEHGAWNAQQITVRVNGVNDPPRLVTGDQADVTESGVKDGNMPDIHDTKSDTGQLKVTDSDSDTGKLEFSITGVRNTTATGGTAEGVPQGEDGYTGYQTDQGTLYINNEGKFYFVLNNDDSMVNELHAGETKKLEFNIRVTDDQGKSVDTWLTVNIHGTNDRPTLELVADKDGHITVSTSVDQVTGTKTTEATLTMTEDDHAVSGKASGDDVDNGHKLTYAVAKGEIGDADSSDINDLTQAFDGKDGTGKAHTSVEGDYGTLSIKEDGTYTYTPKENLVHGHEYEETFTIFVRDEHGAWQQQHLNVKVEGSADAPMIVGSVPTAMVAEVTEAGVHFNTNDDVAASVSGKGTGEISDTEFKLGSFEVKQTDSQDGHGELKAGFITADGTFHEGDLETPYGTLHIEIEGGTATYSFILPTEGSPEAERLNSLTPEDRVKLFDNLKVGIYDSAHADLIGADKGTIGSDGNFSFTIDSGNAGLIPSQSVDIYVHGTNDRPFFTNETTLGGDGSILIADAPHVSEDGGTAAGRLTAHDYDNDDASLRFSIVDGNGDQVQVIQGTYGILSLDEKTGDYTYKLTADPADYQHLNPKQLLELEGFTVRVSDPLHAYTDATLTFQAEGAKDEVTLKGKGISVAEDGGTPDVVDSAIPKSDEGTLKLHATDAQDKPGGAHAFTDWAVNGKEITADGEQTVKGDFGDLKLTYDDAKGEWTYHYELTKNTSEDIQHMALGESRTESFEVTVTNAQGETAKETITVTINGANDKPILDSVTSEGSVKAGVFEADADTTDTAHPGVIFTGTVKGHDDDNALDANGQAIEGKTEGVSYHFLVTDEKGEPVLNEKGEPVTTDVVKTAYGSFIINPATGDYKYILDNENVDRHGIEGIKESIKVVGQDIHGALSDPKDITITLHNADGDGGGESQGMHFNTGDLEGAVKEDGGTVPSKDVANPTQIFEGHLDAVYANGEDSPDHVFGLQDGESQVQTQVNGDYGYLTINPATGDYTYTLFNGQDGLSGPVQSLGAGEERVEHFTLMLNGKVVTDDQGNAITIDITIKGTNDAPVIDGFTSAQGNQLTESVVGNQGHWTGIVEGTVIAHDIDTYLTQNSQGESVVTKETLTFSAEDGVLGEDGKIRVELEGKGTLTLDPVTGTYSFEVAQDHAHLTFGKTEDITFTILVDDGHGGTASKDLTITLNGANLGPEWVEGSETANLQVTEDSTVKATSGTLEGLVFTDDEGAGKLTYSLDASATADKVTMAQGDYGTLIFNDNGTYTYVLDNQSKAVQGLREGETKTESFTVTVWDERGASKTVEVKVDVHGANDAPVATVDRVIVVKEGDADGSAQINAHDNDLMSDGSEEKLSYSFNQDAVDKHNAQAGADRQWTLNTDGSLSTEYGTYTVDEHGKVTFTLDNASDHVIGLGAGELADQTVTVTVSDGHANGSITQNVTVNIEGTNSAPIVTDVDTNGSAGALVEDGNPNSFSGSVTATDPDHGDKVTNYMFLVDGKLVSSVTGDYGKITIDSEGRYTYTLDKNLSQSLAQDQVEQDHFTVVAVDSFGKPSAGTDLDITVKGVNDTPVFTSQTSEASGQTGSFSFTDADVTDTHDLYIVVDGERYLVQDGTVTIDGKGTFNLTSGTDASGKTTWSYTFTGDADTQAGIAQGESENFKFQVEVKDNSGAANDTARSGDFTASITGTNTPPQIGEAALVLTLAAADLVPDAPLTTDEQNLPLDDKGDALTYTFSSITEGGDVQGEFGTLHFNAENGTYSYSLDTSAENMLKLAQHHANGGDLTETFHYDVSDGVNAAVKGDVTVSLTPPASELGSLGNEHADHAQVLFGGDSPETLHGGAGNDILSGGGGDDILFGGEGDDILFGGAGNDYLDGGTGANALYGGDGNDILVYSPDNTVMDGGDGLDFLVGVTPDSIDSLLGEGSPVTNVEVLVMQSSNGHSLTSLGDFADLGLTVTDDNKVSFDSGWAATETTHTDASGMEYVEMHNTENDMTVLVQKSILEHHNG